MASVQRIGGKVWRSGRKLSSSIRARICRSSWAPRICIHPPVPRAGAEAPGKGWRNQRSLEVYQSRRRGRSARPDKPLKRSYVNQTATPHCCRLQTPFGNERIDLGTAQSCGITCFGNAAGQPMNKRGLGNLNINQFCRLLGRHPSADPNCASNFSEHQLQFKLGQDTHAMQSTTSHQRPRRTFCVSATSSSAGDAGPPKELRDAGVRPMLEIVLT